MTGSTPKTTPGAVLAAVPGTAPADAPGTARGTAPKRRRGHARVAAILDAAGRLFLDKGYDAATMTQIAAASGTAIGSLYRFFPSKEAVADALLHIYVEHLAKGLAALLDRAHGMGPAQLADALVDFMLDVRTERSVALALIDARGLEASRRDVRATMLADLGSLLCAVLPDVPTTRIEAMALALLHLLKGVGQVPQGGAQEQPLLDEFRRLVRAYLMAA